MQAKTVAVILFVLAVIGAIIWFAVTKKEGYWGRRGWGLRGGPWRRWGWGGPYQGGYYPYPYYSTLYYPDPVYVY